MYKKASQNEQRRRDADHSPVKLDPTAFKSRDEAEMKIRELVAQKLDIEAQLAQHNERIRSASVRAHQTGRFASAEQWSGMHNKRSELITAKQRVEQDISRIRAIKLGIRDRSHVSFADSFLAAAKEILADEVYNRVAVLAVHRMDPGKKDHLS